MEGWNQETDQKRLVYSVDRQLHLGFCIWIWYNNKGNSGYHNMVDTKWQKWMIEHVNVILLEKVPDILSNAELSKYFCNQVSGTPYLAVDQSRLLEPVMWIYTRRFPCFCISFSCLSLAVCKRYFGSLQDSVCKRYFASLQVSAGVKWKWSSTYVS